ncbi:ABC transporter ATP-binding protein [Sporolactobacillus shoreicorticis]|uniref:ABC transporter ATP-binding protein n=1 Tax=Sporolactobacillus shoreicorticis TaxID=1923877 RepID=A0ABW5S4I1_9BACL|nr:ABC transporter ATP-binding protein [Sporolactobacillus shoreicorticis]MCO7124408.1 ABC transporter ATP-binding protein [Sporolactobacillus shoreicorticis]
MNNEHVLGVKGFSEVNRELISIKDVSLVYKSKDSRIPAIENINLNLYHGEFVCVMGPSGCGKSTLLNILAGFIKPTRGSVKLNQTEIKGIDWHRGVVFQNPPLYEWFSIRKNIAFGPLVRKVPKRTVNEKVDIYLEKVGLQAFADKKVYELSGGMKQRAAIASALINNPEILLMDEPFGALDALTREQMQQLIRTIWWNSKKTIFFITHDVDEALLLGTRVIVMSKHPGKVIADFQTDFTKSIIEHDTDGVRYSEPFHQKRKYILQLINQKV